EGSEQVEHADARSTTVDGTPDSQSNLSGTGKPALSKNKREQLEKEAAQLEKDIAAVEAEISELELCFQNPGTDTDWETAHKRYAELKLTLESLYQDLGTRWELMGS